MGPISTSHSGPNRITIQCVMRPQARPPAPRNCIFTKALALLMACPLLCPYCMQKAEIEAATIQAEAPAAQAKLADTQQVSYLQGLSAQKFCQFVAWIVLRILCCNCILCSAGLWRAVLCCACGGVHMMHTSYLRTHA